MVTAWKSSQYLASLLSTSQIQFIPSPELDKIYTPPPSTQAQTTDLLLTLEKVPLLVKTFSMNDEEANALRRGVVQAQIRLDKLRLDDKGKLKLETEKLKEDKDKVKDA